MYFEKKKSQFWYNFVKLFRLREILVCYYIFVSRMIGRRWRGKGTIKITFIDSSSLIFFQTHIGSPTSKKPRTDRSPIRPWFGCFHFHWVGLTYKCFSVKECSNLKFPAAEFLGLWDIAVFYPPLYVCLSVCLSGQNTCCCTTSLFQVMGLICVCAFDLGNLSR